MPTQSSLDNTRLCGLSRWRIGGAGDGAPDEGARSDGATRWRPSSVRAGVMSLVLMMPVVVASLPLGSAGDASRRLAWDGSRRFNGRPTDQGDGS